MKGFSDEGERLSHHLCIFKLVESTRSDNLISLTYLTEVGVTFPFTRCDISFMLQIITVNHIVLIGLKFDTGTATA